MIREMEDLARQQEAMSEKPPEGVESPPETVDAELPARPSPASIRADATLRASAAEVPGPVARSEYATSPAWHEDWWAWSMVGAGVAAGGVGGGLFLSAADLDEEAAGEPDLARAKALGDRADSRRTAAWMASAAGVAIVAAGVVKLTLHDDSAPRASVVGVVFGPGWLGFQGRF